MISPEERYNRDPAFKKVVDFLVEICIAHPQYEIKDLKMAIDLVERRYDILKSHSKRG